ncbi:MAG: hypothetical protein KAR25_05185 [Methanosarcinales archaeon]|nr:hypothetical protein [Methanosarcinales archaeon]
MPDWEHIRASRRSEEFAGGAACTQSGARHLGGHAAEMGKVVAKLQETPESMNRATKTCGILSDSPRSSTSRELLRGMSGIVKAEIYFD